MQKINIVTFGGGSGHSKVLKGIKRYKDLDISAIVSMMDSGGSTGILRKEYGLLAVGDMRNCLLALSKKEDFLNKIMSYRFTEGCFKGHNMGNIIFCAIDKIEGNLKQGIRYISNLLDIAGHIYPITYDNVNIYAELDDRSKVYGEDAIYNKKFDTTKKIIDVKLNPSDSKTNKDIEEVIKKADYIIISPGSLYCSVLPNLLFKEIPILINKSNANLIFISNLSNEKNLTDGYVLEDYIKKVEDKIQKKLDIIIVNKDSIKSVSKDERYKYYDMRDETIKERNKGDIFTLNRNNIYHNPEKLGQAIYKEIIKYETSNN